MRVDEPETDFILSLARAGMSYACIAQEVYGKKSEYHIRRVSYVLAWERVKVTDYRNGKNPMGRGMISAIRRDANILDAIKAAASQVGEAVRKIKSA